jgi:hypothetical protein
MPIVSYYLGRPAGVWINAMSRRKSAPREVAVPLVPVPRRPEKEEEARQPAADLQRSPRRTSVDTEGAAV